MKAAKVMLRLVGISAELGAEALRSVGFVEAKPGMGDTVLRGPFVFFVDPWGVSDTPGFSGGVVTIELHTGKPERSADISIRVTTRRKALGSYLRFLAEFELASVTRERTKAGL